ncbi:uncharacterized protein TNCV_2977041 [Trichonephila clavipes]|nr:uncharacterized protein TNCV_2977041 [Trichonephila clavipes]
MEPSSNSPSLEHRNVQFSDSFRFFILKTPATFTNVSPFLIEKAITGAIGEVKSIRKMRSGDLFLEVSSSNQATALIKLQKLAHLELTVAPHSNLNFSRGVISPADFLNVSTEEIKENMKAQKVCDVRRITIRRDGQVLNTKHLILTFSTPDLPQTVKMAYIRCPVRPYISKSAALLSVPTIRPLEERLSGPAYLPSLRGIRPRSADCKKEGAVFKLSYAVHMIFTFSILYT